jgi:hypothetical protein
LLLVAEACGFPPHASQNRPDAIPSALPHRGGQSRKLYLGLIDMINLQLVWSGDKQIRDVRLTTALGFEHPKRIRCWIALHKAYLRTQGDLVTDTNEPKAYLLNEHQALLAIMQAKTPTAMALRVELVRMICDGIRPSRTIALLRQL